MPDHGEGEHVVLGPRLVEVRPVEARPHPLLEVRPEHRVQAGHVDGAVGQQELGGGDALQLAEDVQPGAGGDLDMESLVILRLLWNEVDLTSGDSFN